MTTVLSLGDDRWRMAVPGRLRAMLTIVTVTNSGTLLLLDSASMYFRAFHGVKGDIHAPDGTPVNAVRGFLDAVTRLVLDRRPTGVVACWDNDWRPAFRVAAIPSYKAHRVADQSTGAEEVPDLLAEQVPLIEAALELMRIPRIGAAGFEADDVLATITALAVAAERPVEVVSGDRDLLQLIDDAAGVTVLYTGRGMGPRLVVADEAWVLSTYGVPAARYADLAVLRGDPSDGLPGVKGVGEKTGAALVNRFGTVEQVVEAARTAAPEFPPRPRSAVLAAVDYLTVAPSVVRCRTDVPLPEGIEVTVIVPPDRGQVDEFGARWGLSSSLRRLVAALAG